MAILQKPDTLSFAGNVRDFIISGAAKTVTFKLYVDNLLKVSEVYTFVDGRVHIPCRALLESLLSVTIPNAVGDTYVQNNAVANIRAEFDAETYSFTVVKGGFRNQAETDTNFLKNHWLTWQPQEKYITSTQPEWLSYYAASGASVKLKGYFPDSSSQEITFASLAAGKLYSLNFSFPSVVAKFAKQVWYYDVWVEDDSGNRLSYIQRYVLSQRKETECVYVFENSLGGVDTVVFSGQLSEGIETTGVITTANEENNDTDIDFSVIMEQDTGFIPTLDYARWIRGFFFSTQKYHVSDSYRKIYIEDSENKYEILSLNSFSFVFRYSKQTKYDYAIRNNGQLPELLEFPQGNDLFFFSAAIG